MEVLNVLGMRFPVGKAIEARGITRVSENVFVTCEGDIDYFINNVRKEVVNALSENAFNVPDGAICYVLDGYGFGVIYRAYIDNWVVYESGKYQKYEP